MNQDHTQPEELYHDPIAESLERIRIALEARAKPKLRRDQAKRWRGTICEPEEREQ